jgi:hypothetical protein
MMVQPDAYAACRGEGEHACVIGPNEEIVAEFYDSPFIPGMELAMAFAALLNDRDLNHGCNADAERDRTRLFLLLVATNRLRDEGAMRIVSEAVDFSDIKHVRRLIDDQLRATDVPF